MLSPELKLNIHGWIMRWIMRWSTLPDPFLLEFWCEVDLQDQSKSTSMRLVVTLYQVYQGHGKSINVSMMPRQYVTQLWKTNRSGRNQCLFVFCWPLEARASKWASNTWSVSPALTALKTIIPNIAEGQTYHFHETICTLRLKTSQMIDRLLNIWSFKYALTSNISFEHEQALRFQTYIISTWRYSTIKRLTKPWRIRGVSFHLHTQNQGTQIQGQQTSAQTCQGPDLGVSFNKKDVVVEKGVPCSKLNIASWKSPIFFT